MTSLAAISVRMNELRDQQLAWLEHISNTSGLTFTQIARAAGLTPSTLTRFKQQNTSGHTLTSKTVKRIEDATNVPAYQTRTRPKLVTANDQEATPFAPRSDDNPLVASLGDLQKSSNSLELWELKTNSLAASGYTAGMVIVVDRHATPRSGDCVMAEVVDDRRGSASYIYRVFRTPYLLTAYRDREPDPPEVVDDHTVRIAGVILGGTHIRN
jgi:hypothetical protein